MITVTLYQRKNCHLCEQALAELQALQPELPHRLIVIDIESDPKLLKHYLLEVPVIVIGPYRLKAPIDRQDLFISLKAAQNRENQIAEIDAVIAQRGGGLSLEWSGADRFTYWMSKHYLAFFNLLVAIYLGLSFLAPTLMEIGLTTPANLIYKGYGFLCHQLPYRSWFLFGQQAVYPRASAGLEQLLSFNQASGLSEGTGANDVWEARNFIGNDLMGYKVALCQRDVAIYAGILLFGLAFVGLRRRLGALHWLLWLLAGIVPMGLDGTTQLLSQYLVQFSTLLPFRESTPYLRTLTGALFGVMTAWFGYPMVEESMRDAREIMENKLKRIAAGRNPGAAG